MSRSRIISKLIIPITLLTIYSITLYKTATSPVEPTSIEEQEAQTTSNLQTLGGEEEQNNAIPRPPQAPSAITGASNLPEKFRFVVLTDPKMVPATEATWLEPDDVILGIVHDGEAQAFPLNQMAFHHVVNTRVAGDSYVITFCAPCSSQAMAFYATINDVRYTFDIYGIYENKLALIDRQTASVWHQSDGRTISGPLLAQAIPLQPTILTQGSWEDWKEFYPQSLVLPQFPDYINQYSQINFNNSYPDSNFKNLLNKDTRLPPETVVLGTNIGNFYRAYPVNEAVLQNGVINDNLANTPIVIFSDETSGSGMVYQATIDDQVLSFSITNNRIIDSTGSVWDSSGRAIEGTFAGSQLIPIASLLTEWSSWSLYHPETAIYGR